jgi:hypothetical protein
MIAKLIKIVTGRDYVISAGDLGYMMSKGGVPMLAGTHAGAEHTMGNVWQNSLWPRLVDWRF